jgi:hypothetical protein
MGKRKQDVSCDRMHYSCFRSLAVICWVVFLTACTSLKKAGLIGAGTLVPGAIASVATSGTAPVLLASTVGASVTSVVADVMTPSKGGSMPTAASCAPDNFWTLLGDLVSMGGWLLILILVVPMVLGWILPGPLERKKK